MKCQQNLEMGIVFLASYLTPTILRMIRKKSGKNHKSIMFSEKFGVILVCSLMLMENIPYRYEQIPP